MEITSVVKSLTSSSSFGGYGIIGGLGIAGIVYAIFYFINRSNKKELSKIETVNDYKRKIAEKKIDAINDTQSKIIEVINEQEYLEEKTKERIETVISNAVNDIKEVEKKRTVKDVHNTVIDNWKNI